MKVTFSNDSRINNCTKQKTLDFNKNSFNCVYLKKNFKLREDKPKNDKLNIMEKEKKNTIGYIHA